MKKPEWKEFDDIHVPVEVKLDLYEKIEKNEGKKGIFMKRRMRNITIAVAAILLLIAMPLFGGGNDMLDMSAYLSASEAEVKEPLDAVLKEKERLDKALENNTITFDEYFAKINELKTQRDTLLKKQKELDQKYEVNETTIANSKQKTEVETYRDELRQLEALDDELDRQEDELERQYRSGAITKENFIAQKKQLEAQDDELDKKEDQIEAVVGDQDDDRYDNDDDDYDDHDDDDDDHDDDDYDDDYDD